MSTASLRHVVRMGLVGALLLGAAEAARAQAPLVSNDFEDGTLQGWIPRGSTVVLANTTDAANGGTHSLQTTGRTAGFNGPSLDVLALLQKDTVYSVRAAVRLLPGEAATRLKITVQRTPTSGSTAFDQVVGLTSVTDAAWVTLQGTYRFTGDVTGLLLYVESESATASFYLDDFRISLVPVDQSGFVSDFESGTLFGYTAIDGSVRNWSPRGSGVVLTNVTEDAHGGTHSLKATGRTATFMGPSINALTKMTKGFRYKISVWVKLAPGEPATNLRVSVQRTLSGANSFDNVTANVQVTDSQWVLLSANYTLPADVDALSVYVETQTSTTASFFIDDFSLQFAPPRPIQTDIPSLKDVLADDFFFGGAIEPNQTADAFHADLMKKHLSSLTAENAMKWGSIHPSEATYNFTGADTIANFARANGMTMRGHTLLWHTQNPAWLFQDGVGVDLTPSPESKALVLQRLQDHIRTIVGRYGDVVSSWDVVNEVIDASQPDGLRRSRWYDLTGTDFLDVAFQTARDAAGPDAKLCINDFSTTDSAKRQALLTVVQGMLARGLPVSCVGHQMHVNVGSPSAESVRQTLQTFTDLGLDNQITEMDISVYTDSTSRYQVVPEDVLVQQGYRYRDLFKEFRRFKDSISSVTLWGIADDHTWLKSFPITRLDLPLLFDEELQAKHAYWGIVDPLRLPVLIQRRRVLNGTPLLEGPLDKVWSTTGSITVGEEGGSTAEFKLLWNDHHLYVLAEVADATRNPHDQIEIYVDENNGKTTTYEADDARYIFDRAGRGRGPLGDFQFRIVKRPKGYRIEAELPVTRALDAGAEVGFDFRLVDADAGTRVAWNDFTLSQDTDTSKWGTLSLVGGSKITEAVHGTPVIDGVEDKLWAAAPEFLTDVFVLGTSGSTARVKAMWDSGHLYVLARVTDSLLSKASPNPFEQDSVEIFVDQNNAKTDTYQPDDGQYRVNFENTQSFGGSASAAKFVTATTVTSDGYLVEAAITLDAVEPKIGTLLGFDVQVNNDELGNGVRSSVALWNDPTGESFRNTSRLGVLRLVRRPLRP